MAKKYIAKPQKLRLVKVINHKTKEVIYESIAVSEAARQLGFSESNLKNISTVLSGMRPSVRGYGFEHVGYFSRTR
jgi:hypothetical protein